MSTSLTPDDIRILEKTLAIRERIVDNLLKGALPVKPRELDAWVNVMESMDRSVLGKAKIRVEESASAINEETKAILTGLLLDLHAGKATEGFDLAPPETPAFKSNGLSVLEGELIPKIDNVGIEVLDELE